MGVRTRQSNPSPVAAPALALNGVGEDAPAPLWRLQSDAVNARLLERWLPDPLGSVLKTDLYDESVGPGLYEWLREHAEHLVGTDISGSVAAAAARRNPGLEFAVADVRRLPFDDDSFDAVVSNSTLDHLPDEAQVRMAMAEFARVLSPGGRLLITLDNPLNPLIALRNRLPLRTSQRLRQGFPFEPGWTCGPRRLRGLLDDSGLETTSQTAIMHAPRAVAARMGSHSPRGGERALRRLLAFERLEAAPTRYLTGHFVAAIAVKPSRSRL